MNNNPEGHHPYKMHPPEDPNRYWRYPTGKDKRLHQFLAISGRYPITQSTPVTSLGSCFADEIRMRLKDQGYRYVVTEANGEGASANWGRIYNPISMRQLIDYCEQPDWRPAERWWHDPRQGVVDPYRAVATYRDEASAELDFQQHRLKAREALETAEVVVLTYGLVEVWESVRDGAVFQGRPVAFDPAQHRFRVLEYPECLAAIESACAGLRRLHPGVAIILTVSPVPLRATFRPEVTAVSANCYSKAVLVAAVQTAALRSPDTHYFPSYEIVTECAEKPFRADGGVETAAVSLVMEVFERQFATA